MSRREPLVSSPRAVLAIGEACAVLIERVAPSSAARLAAGQSALREVTGDAGLTIGLRPSGRPRLEAPYPELGVSLSHRASLLLVGFSPSSASGADIEIDDPALDVQRLGTDHFAAAEATALSGCAPSAARDLFLRLWVAKEALLKMGGRGVYDGVAAPDLSASLSALTSDGAVITLGGTNLPARQLAVRRLDWPDYPAIYCALAIAG